ncbi:HoxN/HupN/NixA family nickel/cobalt transporter [Alicyclobacillus curvatus]|nr:HoxN/HupN/NixA family nickel/cobalt transporter [Alicyclobacillus curvatus]
MIKRFSSFRQSKMIGVFGFLLLMNLLAWVFVIRAGHQDSLLVSLGTLAYVFGLRHAVDADHIAAIDNTTRKLMQTGKRSLTVGLYFSLGHSSIVFLLTLVVVLSVHSLQATLPQLEHVGSVLGNTISGGFLYLMATLNFVIFLQMFRGRHEEVSLDGLLAKRGLFNRLFRRVFRLIEHSWQMYFVGLLFGLGFETASEVTLLGVSSSASAHGTPMAEVLLLPLLFAAGMSLIDTLDGVFMTYAYGWAFQNPVRKLSYNLWVTGVSVLLAFGIGSLEWLQVFGHLSQQNGGLWSWLDGVDFGTLGYGMIALLALIWGGATVWAFLRRGHNGTPVSIDFGDKEV